MKKLIGPLIWIVALLLLALACWGIALWNDWPLWSTIVLFIGAIALWFVGQFLWHLWSGWRERSLTAMPVEKPEPTVSAESQLKAKWREAISLLKNSNLRQRGNPLYVLPWYMVIGRSGSGKTTALTRARLASPVKKVQQSAAIPEQTLNVDWWFFDRAVVIDTAGRYVAREDIEEDRKEWDKLLDLLGHYRSREGVNGIVLAIQADRLLEPDSDALAEEGRVIRMRIEQLIRLFDKRFPIYVMVTKCDLLYGMEAWTRLLPDGLLNQAMGYVDNASQMGRLDESEFVGKAFESVGTQLRHLQFAMLRRTDNPDPALLLFPNEFARLRPGLSQFLRHALGDSPYLESPFLRGLFFSSGLQAGGAVSAILKEIAPREKEHTPSYRGLFLQDIFDRVLPADRYLQRPAAVINRWRKTSRHLGLIAWGLLVVATAGYLTFSFAHSQNTLNTMRETYPKDIKLVGQLRHDVEALERFRGFAYWLERREQQYANHLLAYDSHIVQAEEKIKKNYIDNFRKYILPGLDDALNRKIAELTSLGRSDELADYIQTFVRRINMVQTVLAGGTHEDLRKMPPLSGAVLFEMDQTMSPEAASHFNEMYVALLAWQPNDIFRLQRLDALKKELNRIALESSNLEWIVSWADAQPETPAVQMNTFWRGSRQVDDLPQVTPAFTRTGKKKIDDFLAEVAKSAPVTADFADKQARFNVWYQSEKLRQWQEFTWRFPYGEDTLRGESEWRAALARLNTADNPYSQLASRLVNEFSDTPQEALPGWLTLNQRLVTLRLRAARQGSVPVVGAINDIGGRLLKDLAASGDSGRARQELEAQIAAGRFFQAYGTALTSGVGEATGGIAKATKLSADFHNLDRDPQGKSVLHDAYARVGDLRRVLGSSDPTDQVAWGLLTGPVQLATRYADTQASCSLQKDWETRVMWPMQSAASMQELSDKLYGDSGTLWAFVDGPARPFLQRTADGVEAKQTLGQQLPFTPDFLPFLNGAVGRQVQQKLAVKQTALGTQQRELKDEQQKLALQSQSQTADTRIGELTRSLDALQAAVHPVSITGLPTGLNEEARQKVISTELNVQCAGSPFRLNNLNFGVTETLNWSPRSCGDAVLTVRFADFSLTRRYAGNQGFAAFMQDFRSGQHIFNAADFPAQRTRLEAADVRQVIVRFSFDGQDAILDATEQHRRLTDQRNTANADKQRAQQQLDALSQGNLQARLQGLGTEPSSEVKLPGRIALCWNSDPTLVRSSERPVRMLIEELVASAHPAAAPPPAPVPASAPAPAPAPTPAPPPGRIVLELTDSTPQLQAAVTAAERWLVRNESRHTLQVWLADSPAAAEQMLKRLGSATASPDRLFAYPTRIGQRTVIALAYGDLAGSAEAASERSKLPDFVQQQRPMIRSNSGIRGELERFQLWR
ncbi:MAG: type VI secretion protein IcmF/TssM N-terminal domain-containing protein [Moraxellaceae bacterium]|nr:type VI secretion protein IcmF/TssM N-terminal domain-containing protein [Moraxellaceae bacterium]